MVIKSMTQKEFNQRMKNVRFGIGVDLRNKLVTSCPVDTGRLKNSIGWNVNGDVIEIKMVNYALYVEFGCFFDEDTLIRTDKGLESIKNLDIHSNVWTGKEWKKLIQKEKIEVGYPINKIIIKANGNKLELTEDHPVKTKNGWKKAGELTEQDEVYIDV